MLSDHRDLSGILVLSHRFFWGLGFFSVSGWFLVVLCFFRNPIHIVNRNYVSRSVSGEEVNAVWSLSERQLLRVFERIKLVLTYVIKNSSVCTHRAQLCFC